LAIIYVLVVEAKAGQGHVAGFPVRRFATAHLWPPGLDETAGSQDARKGVIALGTLELESELAGPVNPDPDLLFFPRCGIGFRQALDDLPPDEVPEQIGFGGFRDLLQVIDLSWRKAFSTKERSY
jgi:hypothetical protein